MGKSAESRRHHTSGVDSMDVFREMLSGGAPTGMREMDLVFAVREIAGGNQIVSILDDGTIIYPLTERWRPGLSRRIPCYVLIQERDGQRRGFAMPREMRDALRHGEVLPPRNSVKVLEFRAGDDGRPFGFASNGKRVIVPKESGVKITSGELESRTPVAVLVEERMSAFVARARVKDEALDSLTRRSEQSVTALTHVTEAAGADMEAFSTMVFVGDGYYDAVAELGVDKNATRDQIKAAYRNLSREYHPDKRLTNEKRLLGGRPVSDERKEEITHEFQVIQESYNRLMLLRVREEAAKRWSQAGVNALGKNLASMTGGEVLGFLQTKKEQGSENGDGVEIVRRGLVGVGYPGVDTDTTLSSNLAAVLAGCLVEQRAEAADDKKKDKSPAKKKDASRRRKSSGKKAVVAAK